MKKKRKRKALLLLLSFAVTAFCFTAPGSRTGSYGATAKNSQYSLAGAEYQLYLDAACSQPAKDKNGNNAVLITGENGSVPVMEAETRTSYYAKETKASRGYLLDSKVYPVTVTKDNTMQNPASFSSTEMPTVGRMISLRKYDQTGENGWRKLLGAEYTLRYYDADPSRSDVSGMTPLRTWKFSTVRKTGKDGHPYAGIDFASDTPLDGSSDFYEVKAQAFKKDGTQLSADDREFDLKFHHYRISGSGAKTRVMPIGVFTIEETKAPPGLKRNTTVYYGSVSQPSNGADAVTAIRGTEGFNVNVLTGEAENAEDLQKIEIVIEKVAAHSGNDEQPDRETSLAGAEYNVYFDDPALGEAELVGRITTDDEGKGRLTRRTMGNQAMLEQDLRPGTYFIEEVSAPDGFLIDKYVLAEDGSTEEFTGEIEVICDYEANGAPVKKRIRGNYEDGQHRFIARAQVSGAGLFRYTLKSVEYETETRIRKTDAASAKELPGAGLQIFSLNEGSSGELIEEWTSTNEEHVIYGLASGRYLLRETTAPDGYDIAEDIEFEVKNNEIVSKVEMQNKPVAAGTVATDKSSGTHHGIASDGTVLMDTVKLSGLCAGRKYRVSGILMDKATGEPYKDADGREITAETAEFTAAGNEMEVVLEFTFNSSGAGIDTTLVAFEKLFRTSAVPVAEGHPEREEAEELPRHIAGHEDIGDEDQTLHFGGIVSTTAADAESGSRNVLAAKTRIVTDTVRYRNLAAGQKYLLEGEWYDKTDGRLTGIKAVRTFTPPSSDGLTDVVFKFDTSRYEGHALVCYEKLYVIPQDEKGRDRDPVEVHKHENPDDPDQTVFIPEIRTKAGKLRGSFVTDTVAYRNLIPGRTYICRGWFVDKKTGKKIAGSDGELKFTAKKAGGSVRVDLRPGSCKGPMVAFEEMYIVTDQGRKVLVGEHKDINDEDQLFEREAVKDRKKTPVDTGDSGKLILWIAFFTAALMLLSVLIILFIRKRRSGDGDTTV